MNAFATVTIGQVSTTSLETEVGTYKLEYSRRSTEKNPIDAAQRYRAALIGEDQLRIDAGAVPSKFTVLLQSTIYDLAQTKFQKEMLESNMLATTINPSSYTIDAVLAFWATKRESEKVDAATITAWLTASATLKQPGFEDGTKKRAVWLNRIPKIAAPAYKASFSQAEAASILAQFNDADLENPIGAFVATRLNTIIEQQSQESAF